MDRTRTPDRPAAATRFTEALERAVAPLEAKLDGLPLVRAQLDGAIERGAYVKLLQSLLLLHRHLERAIAAAPHLAGFHHPTFQREEALLRDLRLLRGHLPIRESEPIGRFASLVAGWARPPCAALVGALAALERRRKESLRFARPLAAAFRVKVATRSGFDYHLDGSARAARRLADLEAWMDQNLRHPERVEEALEGATRTLETLVAVHQEEDAPAR